MLSCCNDGSDEAARQVRGRSVASVVSVLCDVVRESDVGSGE